VKTLISFHGHLLLLLVIFIFTLDTTFNNESIFQHVLLELSKNIFFFDTISSSSFFFFFFLFLFLSGDNGNGNIPTQNLVDWSDATVTLEWEAPYDFGGGILKEYVVEQEILTPLEDAAPYAPIYAGTLTKFIAQSTIVAGSTYNFRVRAISTDMDGYVLFFFL